MSANQTSRRFLRVAELAELLAVKPSWIYDRTCVNGPEIIPHLKLGRQVRFDLESDAFQAWVQDHVVETTATVHVLDSAAS